MSTAQSSGRHFLQIPGPTNVPDRILRAMAQPTIDHRGPAFAEMVRGILRDLGEVFGTSGDVAVFPASGTGAWEAALVNALSPGEGVLMYETGHFATLWRGMAERLGLAVEFIPGDWRGPVDAAALEARLRDDPEHRIKAVAVVHNETSTGVTSDVPAVRAAIDAAGHPALLMVDTVSSLASIEYRHDDWGVDVTVSASQKGLMLPPGLGFNAVGGKALEAAEASRSPRSYWDWRPMLAANQSGRFPYTPATNLLFGLQESIAMLREEGLENVLARHHRLAEAARRAVAHWGFETVCRDPAAASNTLTGVMLPEGHDADAFRTIVLERFDLALGNGLGRLEGRVFRIGHLGDFNDLMLAATLSGIEMGLAVAEIPFGRGGVGAALDFLAAR